MMRVIATLLGSIILATLVESTFANNNLFLPGDAFFPAELTLDDVTKLNAAPTEFQFEYSAFGGYPGAFCGYAGYRYGKVESVNESFAANLKKAYETVRETEPRKLRDDEVYGDDEDAPPTIVKIEANPVRVLFYDEKFDLKNLKIGLRYNETWVEDALLFGHRRNHIRLCCIVGHESAVMTSWRDSTLVSPIGSTLPKIVDGEYPDSESAATITGKTKAVVFGSTPISDYFSPDDGAWYMVVNEKGVTKMTQKNQEWIAEKLQ